MFFKQVSFYRVYEQQDLTQQELIDKLQEFPFTPCEQFQTFRSGFVPPAGGSDGPLVHEVNGHRLMCLRIQEKMLPKSVVESELSKRVDDHTARTGQVPDAIVRMQLKEAVYQDLIPRAFTKDRYTHIWWDAKHHLIGVDSISHKKCDEALDMLRMALDTLKVKPVSTNVSADKVMTKWLNDPDEIPEGFKVGDSIDLHGDYQEVIRGRSVSAFSTEVRSCMKAGYRIKKLELEYLEGVESIATLTLSHALTMSSIKFDPQSRNQAAEDSELEDFHMALFEADLLIMGNYLHQILTVLIEQCSGEPSTDFNGMEAA